MAKKKRAAAAAKSTAGAAKPGATAAAAAAGPREIRRYIYAGLDVVFAIGYFVFATKFALTQSTLDRVQLMTLPVFAAAMGAGMLISGQVGWWITVAGCGAVLLSAVLLIARILISIAFLSGVYGGFGAAATFFAWVAVALIVEAVVLLPLFQLKFAMSRAGRRAFGLPAPLPVRATASSAS
jgi:hypothetical protein